MDIRPVDTVGQITLTRTEPRGGRAPFSALPADGVTVDTYQGHGGPAERDDHGDRLGGRGQLVRALRHA